MYMTFGDYVISGPFLFLDQSHSRSKDKRVGFTGGKQEVRGD